MSTRAHRIEDWTFSPEDRLFFDTNIWMLLLGVQGNPQSTQVAVYSNAYKRILKANCALLTDTLVLAEFYNAALRVRHELAIRFFHVDSDFKRFRESQDFADVASQVSYDVRQIVEGAQVRVLPAIIPVDWPALLAELERGVRDFNDELILAQCQAQNALLVTNDRDFVGADVEILTANSVYFRRPMSR